MRGVLVVIVAALSACGPLEEGELEHTAVPVAVDGGSDEAVDAGVVIVPPPIP